jgi:hypothetical protein
MALGNLLDLGFDRAGVGVDIDDGCRQLSLQKCKKGQRWPALCMKFRNYQAGSAPDLLAVQVAI